MTIFKIVEPLRGKLYRDRVAEMQNRLKDNPLDGMHDGKRALLVVAQTYGNNTSKIGSLRTFWALNIEDTADFAKVSGTSVKRARRLIKAAKAEYDKADELINSVLCGEMPLSEAARNIHPYVARNPNI